MTLEDETGNVNVIVWPTLVEQQRAEVLRAPLLGVYGIWHGKAMCATWWPAAGRHVPSARQTWYPKPRFLLVETKRLQQGGLALLLFGRET